MNPLGHVRQRVTQHERALQHLQRRDAVRDVDDLDLWRDALHDAVTRAHEIVGDAEVREERDDGRHQSSEPSDRIHEPAEVVPLGFGDDADARLARRPARLRADGDRGHVRSESSERTGGRRRREHDEIALRRHGSQLHRPVQRQEVGAQLVDDGHARSFCGREQHAPGGSRQLREQAFLRRDLRNEIGSDAAPQERGRRPWPDGGDPRRSSTGAVQQLVGAVGARDDHPVVRGQLDLVAPDSVDADQRAEDDLVTKLLDPRSQRLRLAGRTRDDDFHAVALASDSATSSRASWAGSSPRRRSTQRPSSSAISASS